MGFRDNDIAEILQYLGAPLGTQEMLIDHSNTSEFAVLVKVLQDQLGRWPRLEDAFPLAKQPATRVGEYLLYSSNSMLGTIRDNTFDDPKLPGGFQFIPIQRY